MTFSPARENRIRVYLPVLESLVSMLNANINASRQAAFQKALRARFDEWIKNGKPDQPQHLWVVNQTMLYQIGRDGEAEYRLEFREKSSKSKERASMWFGLLQTIEGRNLLSKCSECDQYFLRMRLPKGDKQPEEDYCSAHKFRLRVRSTKIARKKELDRRVKEAAKFAHKWTASTHVEQWLWVADSFNKGQDSHANRMTVSWLTRHEEEIKAELERLCEPKDASQPRVIRHRHIVKVVTCRGDLS